MKLNLNNDIQFHLRKVADKRKITVEKLINSILLDWVDDLDNQSFNVKKSNKKGLNLVDQDLDLSVIMLNELLTLVSNAHESYGDIMIHNPDGKVNYKKVEE